MTTEIDSTAAATTAAAKAAGATSRLPSDQLGKDTFLKLLVAQLKYQNPLEPTDGAQFMAQTAQFTTVEKLSALVEKMSEMVTGERASTATSLVGRTVSATKADGSSVTGTVTGVRLDPSGPLLKVGDAEVLLANVKEVSAPPSA